MDTHSKKVVMNKAFVADMAREAGCPESAVERISQITLARELWKIIPSNKINTFSRVVIAHCYEHCAPLLPNGRLIILLIDENGRIYSND
jgi:cobalt-precorrin-5B (C1)-methyltransferase